MQRKGSVSSVRCDTDRRKRAWRSGSSRRGGQGRRHDVGLSLEVKRPPLSGQTDLQGRDFTYAPSPPLPILRTPTPTPCTPIYQP